MKYRLLTLLSAAAVICSCVDDSLESYIEVSYPQENVIELPSQGGSHNIRFKAGSNWTVAFEGEWISVSENEGEAGSGLVKVSADANNEPQKRTAILRLLSGDAEEVFTVEQDVFVPTFELVNDKIEISACGGSFVVETLANVDYSYEFDVDWISDAPSKTASISTSYFYASANTLSEERSATITLHSGNQALEFEVIQRPAPVVSHDWIFRDFIHRSLAMRFTADWCGYCPYMATAFESAREQMLGRFEVLTLHCDGGLLFAPSNTLATRYQVSGFPTGVVDGRASIPNYSSTAVTAQVAMDVAKETQDNYPSAAGISINSYVSGSEVNIGLSLYFKKADKYRVAVLLLEDDIIAYQNGGGSNYEHDYVARVAFTSISGDPVYIEEDNTVWTSTYSDVLPQKCNPENLRVLVWVERPYGDQNAVENVEGAEYGSYGDTYVDNCCSTKVGTDIGLY